MKVFKFSKNRKNRILDPFAHPPDLTINILPHKLREKDTCKGGDSAAGSAGDSKETDSIPYLFSSVLYPYNGSSLFRLLGRHSSSLTREWVWGTWPNFRRRRRRRGSKTASRTCWSSVSFWTGESVVTAAVRFAFRVYGTFFFFFNIIRTAWSVNNALIITWPAQEGHLSQKNWTQWAPSLRCCTSSSNCCHPHLWLGNHLVNARSDCGNRFEIAFFPPFSPGPWKEVCVRQHVLSGDFEGRKKMNA